MNWIKLLVGFAVVAFCVFLGYLAATKYRNRKKFFTQLALFNERYLTELCYQRKPLAAFLQEYPYTGDFSGILKSFAQNREFSLNQHYLSKEEKKFCTDYFVMLGKGDAVSQKSYYSAQKGELETKKTSSEKEAKSRGELYLKLGLLAGLAFVILIV